MRTEGSNGTEKSSENRTGEFVESMEDFHRSRNVIEDFSSHTLAAISSCFGRLYYVSSLKDSESGRYEHDGLTSLYPEKCRAGPPSRNASEELFSRILETPLQRAGERSMRVSFNRRGTILGFSRELA